MKKLTFLAGIVVTLSGCVKSAADIPNVAVNFSTLASDPRVSALNVAGGAVLINGYGVAGLILYHEADGSYAAYDRCSTVNPQNRCAVTLDPGNFTVTDPCTGAKWILTNGGPAKAPATVSLKSYNIEVTNGEIYVSN